MVQEAYQIKYFYQETTPKDEAISLSIFVSSHHFQYAIFSQDYKWVYELAEVEFNESQLPNYQSIDFIAMLVNNNHLNQKKFQKVNIALLNNKFSLVPEAFYDASNLEAVMAFSTGIHKDYKVLNHKTKYCTLYYAFQNEWLDYFGKTFPQAAIHHAGALHMALHFEHFSLSNTKLFLQIHGSQLEISIKDAKNLIFYNVFSYQTKEDILYYLLFTMEQMALNPLLCTLTIAAQTQTKDDLIKSIKKYVKHVDFCVLDKSISFKNQTNNLPHHFYFSLLNQHLCAL